MLKSDFSFDLPTALIAQIPLATRSASRLLCLTADDRRPRDCYFKQFADLLNENDLLVLNDTQVIPARLFGRKTTGGKVEILLERILDQQRCLAHIKASKSPQINSRILVADEVQFEVLRRHDDLFELQVIGATALMRILEDYGHMPLPPYIRRPDNQQDQSRYQTVYAHRPGAVAAPTAGLHFDEAMLQGLRTKGVNMSKVTLHVGAGTFQPVRVAHIEKYQMHEEYIEVSQQVVDAVRETHHRRGRVIAVGTTSVRALEAAARSGELRAVKEYTDIFIYPGYQFRVVDGLLTNFHLPESSLLMLVSAFGGHDRVMAAYRHAVRHKYRFFSYGDAMFVEPFYQDLSKTKKRYQP